ncbi:hypothetical protein [Streptomyces sp. NPDC049590]|uniref:hypothetical protein n=1 Tax=Streptomyces sp. NPDC049590 TaxID=3154834 RepID=UPI00343AAE52
MQDSARGRARLVSIRPWSVSWTTTRWARALPHAQSPAAMFAELLEDPLIG